MEELQMPIESGFDLLIRRQVALAGQIEPRDGFALRCLKIAHPLFRHDPRRLDRNAQALLVVATCTRFRVMPSCCHQKSFSRILSASDGAARTGAVGVPATAERLSGVAGVVSASPVPPFSVP